MSLSLSFFRIMAFYVVPGLVWAEMVSSIRPRWTGISGSMLAWVSLVGGTTFLIDIIRAGRAQRKEELGQRTVAIGDLVIRYCVFLATAMIFDIFLHVFNYQWTLSERLSDFAPVTAWAIRISVLFLSVAVAMAGILMKRVPR